jgi:hypothetical protein
VPSRIVIAGPLARAEGQERIRHLAAVRNAAIAPLLDASFRASVFDPDYVVFVNDVLTCASDLLRLAYWKADIACGLDLGNSRSWAFYVGRPLPAAAAACCCRCLLLLGVASMASPVLAKRQAGACPATRACRQPA